MKRRIFFTLGLYSAGLLATLALAQAPKPQGATQRRVPVILSTSQFSRDQLSELAALNGQAARVRVLPASPENPQGIIVIYTSGGGCICLGKGSECRIACGRGDAANAQ
jgi:hypothetical protein